MIGDLYWHVHHEILCEPLTEPIENRISYIKANKPAHEIETRLRLMQPVRGPLPAELDKVSAEWDKARAKWDKASAELDKASAEWGKARAKWVKTGAEWGKASAAALPELERLHAEQCPDCLWDGQTIFPKEEVA